MHIHILDDLDAHLFKWGSWFYCTWPNKFQSADYFSYCISCFTLKYVRYWSKIVCNQHFMCAWNNWEPLTPQHCIRWHYRSMIRSVCLDVVLHLWWKHPLALSDMDSFHVWVLALLVVVCRMCLEGREIAISDFVKDNVLLTLGDCRKKVRLLLPEHALNIEVMMKC